ncbi:glucose/arabinose dehydrogenase [Arthrobacter stackebrandtii]|uniref:Glucose/arabinose dehydrogenase n=1 Tax=Arthrobacter stackebrandtii TaxID=272161 RepID=A0ABS4Z0E2_9MICC|nr:PQQ-dependent sugar dehydrogenase [Arthrobacter stackebrandtii]MBP2414513.1 glucose/arabinose dehydrogenase [Arthrobacter stackebrandtii]PYH01629.1 glucose dehydrogenase [Arthrobacter stackebrandtii]
MDQRGARQEHFRRGFHRPSAIAAGLAAVALLLSSCQSPAPSPMPSEVSSDVATGLQAPWSMVALGDGHLLVSERDTGQILDVAPDGTLQFVGSVPGVVHQGEGGLLGLAAGLEICTDHPTPDPATGCLSVYAYLTTADDNRIVRMPLLGQAGNRSLGPAVDVLTGIPKGNNHNGGRIKFGPDGMLYIGTGDAGNRNNAQNPMSLGGKILRIAPDGTIPRGNPVNDSPVWTLGHRNVQGLAWDETGRMWASEFGQNTWDELNQIKAGNNYGWPLVEGQGTDPQFTNPALEWPTSEASPSGIAITGTTLYMASLRGERLWQVTLDGEPSASARLSNQLGRLRDVVLTPDGRLLVLTNNTDGRGNPKPGDDKIVELGLD